MHKICSNGLMASSVEMHTWKLLHPTAGLFHDNLKIYEPYMHLLLRLILLQVINVSVSLNLHWR